MKSLNGPIIKSLIFIVVTAFATTMLALTITNGAVGGTTYTAIFTNATSVNEGDDVRIAGVRVGQVQSVQIHHRRQAKITFSVQDDVRLAKTVTATIRYRNMIGQRYLQLDEGTGSLDSPLPGGATIPTSRTSPALDLTVLFNGFQPLFQALSHKQVNELTAEIVQVFQGEGPTIDNLLVQTASLTNTLADKDRVIKAVIDNLNSVLTAVNGRGSQLDTLISTLSRFVSGLAQDRTSLGRALTGIAGLTTDVADLLTRSRPAIKTDIVALGALSKNLAGSSGALNSFLQTLPGKLTKLGRIASYGSWLNFYMCTITGRIPVPVFGGAGQPGTAYGNVQPDGSVSSAGLVGADNPAARCHG